MELAGQITSSDQKVRSNTIQDLKDFNCQSLATQTDKGEQLISIMPADNEAFDLMGDDLVGISTKSEPLKDKRGSYAENCLEESKEKVLKQINGEKRASLIMSRMQKQMKKL